MLFRSRELQILASLVTTPGPRARERLQAELVAVGEWLPQIRAVAECWRARWLQMADLMQAGLVGLLEAASRYDVAKGAQGWPTFAHAWIRRRIAELAQELRSPVRETRHEQRQRQAAGEKRRRPGWAPLDITAMAAAQSACLICFIMTGLLEGLERAAIGGLRLPSQGSGQYGNPATGRAWRARRGRAGAPIVKMFDDSTGKSPVILSEARPGSGAFVLSDQCLDWRRASSWRPSRKLTITTALIGTSELSRVTEPQSRARSRPRACTA